MFDVFQGLLGAFGNDILLILFILLCTWTKIKAVKTAIIMLIISRKGKI